MYARVSELTGPVDKQEEGIRQYRDVVLPAMRGQDGFNRAYLLVDRETGKTLSITVWESLAALQASDAAADVVRDQVVAATSTTATVSRYEIAVADPTG